MAKPPQMLQIEDWNDIYIAALLEGDPDKVPFLIQEAEHAIIERVRELFKASGDIFEEEEALNDALYALRAAWAEKLPGSRWAIRGSSRAR